ncbi:sulfite exporter TauE/SafE family protein [Thermocrispum municipale]|jgi:hypothetical protein|uniref:sulfite exporter TauE/SafE family protein n=1 Tax=Thermocrispum municipale TaxID=37926 RepID=UPI0003FCE874|nr:sulfite exporter TauE/SafE family protein [Thermocrispum municipale]
MQMLLLFGLAGLLAQLVDGSLGMAFGVTATTTLLAIGVAPAVASASIHLAEVGTTLVSGFSHWRFNNVDWRTVGLLALPGAIGAALGAYALSSISTDFAGVWIAALLTVLGLYVLVRFAFLKLGALVAGRRPGAKFLAPLGLVAGFVDASGGGGWGPIATSTLLSSGRLHPRKVIGSVSASEFIVALSASISFFFALTGSGVNFTIVLGLLIGGVIAAPLAAWLVRFLPPRVLGAAAGGLIVLTNAGSLLEAASVPRNLNIAIHVALVALWAAGVVAAVRATRAERAERAKAEEEAEPALAGE